MGGSGFYSWLDSARPVAVETPFGPPSDTPVVGTVRGRSVAFIPRHGQDHRFPPHRVNYRANLWALRSLGVRQVLAPCAVGSMRPDLGPGTLVLPDQLVDRTGGREHTVYGGIGPVVHIPFSDPFCPQGQKAVREAGSSLGWEPVQGATLAVINGPRFSTRAESRQNAAQGCDLVGMTTMPEAAIARELALCYTSIAVVTDMDAGFETGEGVTQSEVFEVFARSVERLKQLLAAAVRELPPAGHCSCQRVLDGLKLPFDLP
ncbi:MAG: S-methyl-5-thioadenosine phosphorylase [Actinomycetota bacterium]|nr:S-methyl-5-thioadenosine phosphorylase [Actinomycetota bacterium]